LFPIAKRIAKKLREYDNIMVVTHIDADGISAGSIASMCLSRYGKEHDIKFIKQLDEPTLESIKSEGYDLIWFTDLGSGVVTLLKDMNAVITDHHQVNLLDTIKSDLTRDARMDILKFSKHVEAVQNAYPLQLNPHLENKDGATDLSGAGATYIVARELSADNVDLSALAIVGAVGDLQDLEHRQLVGTNRKILSEALEHGVIERSIDIRYFGRETRPVHVLLQYATDPALPGLTKNEEGCIELLRNLDIELKTEPKWRYWIDLTPAEKQKIVSELIVLLLSKGYGHKIAMRVFGEIYTLPREREGTELHDAKEFATLLNACGRYNCAMVGYNVCLGDRSEWLERAKQLLSGHRKNLVEMLKLVENIGVTQKAHIQYFHGGNRIADSIVGIVAGMLLGSCGEQVVEKKPIIAFADTEDGSAIKVSARANRILIDRGLDLAVVMKVAAETVGGVGGGHNVAAGAVIPRGTEDKFLAAVDTIVKSQLTDVH
jgi:RecJ-like exonuclease